MPVANFEIKPDELLLDALLRGYLQSPGLTIYEVQRESKVNKSTLYLYASGATKSLTGDVASKVMKYIGVTFDGKNERLDELIIKKLQVYPLPDGTRIADVSRGAGVCSKVVNRLKRRERNPRLTSLSKLADYFGMIPLFPRGPGQDLW